MKKVNLLMGVLLILVSAVYAQTNKEEVDLYQSIFGMEKKAIVADFVKLKGVEATSFWDLYDQYETERKKHGQERIDLLHKYSKEYEDLTVESTNSIMKEMITLGNDYNKLIQKYYKSINKASGAKAAAQFYQLEIYFQSAIRLTVMEQIPMIGEFDD